MRKGTAATKAIGHHVYGPPDLLALEDIDRPAIGDNDLLVRMHAAGMYPDAVMTGGIPHVVTAVRRAAAAE